MILKTNVTVMTSSRGKRARKSFPVFASHTITKEDVVEFAESKGYGSPEEIFSPGIVRDLAHDCLTNAHEEIDCLASHVVDVSGFASFIHDKYRTKMLELFLNDALYRFDESGDKLTV